MKKLEIAEKMLGEAVSAMDFDLDKMGLVDLVGLQNELRQMHEKIDEHKCAIGKLYDHIRTNVVPAKMDEEGVDNITVTGVGRVSLTSDIYLRVVDKEKSFDWLEENGHADMIVSNVNSSSLKALLRRMLRDGVELPQDVFAVTPFTRASITKV